MDVGVAFMLFAMTLILILALATGAYLAYLFVRGLWRFLRFCLTVTYHPRRR